MDYRIVRRQYFDARAICTSDLYYVERWERGLLGRYRWRPLVHCTGGPGDSYTVPTDFKTAEDASAFIQRLEAGAPRFEHVKTVVQQISV
jgi:hypothetical protein